MRMTVFCALICAAFLAGCAPIYETMYDYTAPASQQGLLCISQCNQISALCRQNCELKEQRCLAEERERGARDYEYYVRDQQRDGKEIEKDVDDFTNTYRCTSASTCKSDCTTPYNQCFTSCGGKVTSRQVCTAFCN